MDTFPWLEGAFLEYKNRHSITKIRSYSSLCEESNGLIDFVPPSGFSFRYDTAPSKVLHKSVSLRLPARAFGLGFIHNSPESNKSNPNSMIFGPYFMYGKVSVNDGGTIEAYYSQKIGSRGQFSLSSLLDNYYESSVRNMSSSQSRTHFQWDFGRLALSSSYCTFGKILGLQFLFNPFDNGFRITEEVGEDNSIIKRINRLSFGGEVYYTAQEVSGGISLGARLIRTIETSSDANYPIIFTLTGNPLMGHYRSTLTSPFFSPNLSISTRFDVNINSFDSDLAIGVAYRDPSPLNQGIRCSLGLKNGFAFDIQTNVTENIKIRFGLKTGPFSSRLGDNVLKTSTGSFGLDVAICN